MRRAPALLFISLAACGSGNSPPLFGGFTPSSGAAVILAPATCNIAFLGPAALSGILIELTSAADACKVLTQAGRCGTGSGSTTLLAGAFSGVTGGTTVAPAGPGTYPWLANPPSGAFNASTTSAVQVDAICTAAVSPTDMSGGSIVISTVTASRVSGSMDVHFDNGQAYTHPFDVAICPISIDACALFGPCLSNTCVPP